MSDKPTVSYINRATGEACKSTAEGAIQLPLSLADVTAELFATTERAALIAYLSHIQSLDLPTVINGDWPQTGALPEDYNVAVYPIGNHEEDAKEAGKKKRVVKQLAIIAQPSAAAIWAAGALGQTFVEEAIARVVGTNVRNRIGKPGADGIKLPFAIAEFITPVDRADPAVAAWKVAAPTVRAGLEGIGIKGLPDAQIQSCLRMRSFAEALFGNVPQLVWERCLTALIKACNEGKIKASPAVFEHWLATRDTMTNDVVVADTVEFNF